MTYSETACQATELAATDSSSGDVAWPGSADQIQVEADGEPVADLVDGAADGQPRQFAPRCFAGESVIRWLSVAEQTGENTVKTERLIAMVALPLLILLYVPAVQAQGAYSSYLVGTWETRLQQMTQLQIVNPTTSNLDILVTFWNADEECTGKLKASLSANDLWEMNLVWTDAWREQNLPRYGVVKIISLDQRSGSPRLGIVGFQRKFHLRDLNSPVPMSESPLAAVPHELAAGELSHINTKQCREL